MTTEAHPLQTQNEDRQLPLPQARRFGFDALHVFVLTSFVIAQSYYDRLAHQGEYLVDPKVTPAAIAGLVIILSVVLPSLIVAAEGLAGRVHRQLRDSVHLVVVLLCFTLLFLQVVQRAMFLPGWLMLVTALATACALTAGYDRYTGFRSMVTWVSPGIVLFPGILFMRLNAAEGNVAHRATHDLTQAPVPVVVVVFDEFCGASLLTPDREIDADRFPNFARLQQGTTWYRGAASVSPATASALPALLSSKYTLSEYARSSKELPQNLFSLLSMAGQYELAAFEPLSALCPRQNELPTSQTHNVFWQTAGMLNVLNHVYLYQICPPDFHAHLPVVPPAWFGLHDTNLVDRNRRRGCFRYGWTDRRDQQVEHFLECIDSTPQSVLYFAHLLIPHAPWCYFPSGTRYARDRSNLDRLCLESDDTIMSDELGVIQNQQRHLLQVMYVDNIVGQLTARLKEVGIWDRCLLIVTADHGISFRIGQDRREYTGGNTEDLLSIPLFIKSPGQTVGEVNDLPVQSIDLLPTILDVVGIHPAAPLDGVPVSDPRVALRTQVIVRDSQHDLAFSPEVLLHSQVPRIIRKRFGAGTDRWNLYRIGPHSEWLGQPVQGLPLGQGAPLKLECQLPLLPANSIGAELRPYHIEGRIVSPSPPEQPVELIAVVDGVVCGTTRTYRQFGYLDRWSVMLPEWSYLSSTATPDFFAVQQDGSLVACDLSWVETLGESPNSE